MKNFKFINDISTVKPSRTPLVAAIVLAAAILFPSAVTLAATPLGHYGDKSSAAAIEALAANGIHDPNLKVVTVDDLTVLGKPAIGYVNVFTKEDVIYIRPIDGPSFQNNRGVFNSIITHEYGHILQKHLINSVSSNPYDRYAKLIELNNDLTKGAPKLANKHAKLVFDGIETNADCILSVYNALPRSAYIKAYDGCNLRGRAMAEAVIAGQFPTDTTVVAFEAKVKKEEATHILQNEQAVANTIADTSASMGHNY
jgi:hypothetical protein